MSIRTGWHKLSRSPARAALGAALGLLAGAAFAHFYGCESGSCPITASVWRSALYGGIVGAIAAWPSRY